MSMFQESSCWTKLETKTVVPILSTSLHAHEPSDEANCYEALDIYIIIYIEFSKEGPEADPCLRRPCTG